MKKFPENKIEPKKRARFIEACNAQIPLVCYIFIKDAEIPALLARDITYGIAGSGRNSVYCGECDMPPPSRIRPTLSLWFLSAIMQISSFSALPHIHICVHMLKYGKTHKRRHRKTEISGPFIRLLPPAV